MSNIETPQYSPVNSISMDCTASSIEPPQHSPVGSNEHISSPTHLEFAEKSPSLIFENEFFNEPFNFNNSGKL